VRAGPYGTARCENWPTLQEPFGLHFPMQRVSLVVACTSIPHSGLYEKALTGRDTSRACAASRIDPMESATSRPADSSPRMKRGPEFATDPRDELPSHPKDGRVPSPPPRIPQKRCAPPHNEGRSASRLPPDPPIGSFGDPCPGLSRDVRQDVACRPRGDGARLPSPSASTANTWGCRSRRRPRGSPAPSS